MNSVTIGGYNSYTEWGLLLKEEPKVSPPEPQTHDVEIPGLDGYLDLAPGLYGGKRYKPRDIKIQLFSCAPQAEWPDIESDLMEKLHGETVQIIMEDDPGYYFLGRVSVAPERGRHTLSVTVTAKVNPYKTAIDGGGKKL